MISPWMLILNCLRRTTRNKVNFICYFIAMKYAISLFVSVFSSVLIAQTPPVSLLGGDPLGTTPPDWPSQANSVQPSARWSSELLGSPLPTNAWWLNFVVGSESGPANALPYIVKCTGSGLQCCQPSSFGNAQFVGSAWVANWTLGATEAMGNHEVVAFDPLSVTVEWGSGGLVVPVVRGMAYVSAFYSGWTPEFTTVHAILSVNGLAPETAITSDRFEVVLNNGQTWVAYASSPLTLSANGGVLQASGPFEGGIRWAVMTSNEMSIPESVLDAHADAVPMGGDVMATAEGDQAVLQFHWNTQSLTGGAAGAAPLQFALPHHLEVLQESSLAGASAGTIKGQMNAIGAQVWNMTEELTAIGFESPGGIEPALQPHVESALAEDLNFPITAGDTYFGGKQLAAVGRLALIADELGDASSGATARANLNAALTPWLEGTNGDPLRYDATWGGVVSASGGSFDQGSYNDHHFHYGYFLYAAAVMAKDDPAWAAQWGDEVNQILRNIANPTDSDPHYTMARNKDWFVGHSWAQGLYEGGDGRNQESSSEAVNAWYGVYLWGLAIGDERIRDLGRLMLATEMRATHTYWQITSDSEIYPEPFASNKVVGVLWSNKVDHATWFGGNLEFIHGIQMLPYTPISEELLRPEWIEEEYPVVSAALDDPFIGEGWKGFIYMAHAIIDPVSAWWEVDGLTGYDDGNTKTNTLYWLATRPGADGIQTEPVDAQVTFSVDMSNTALVNGSVYITGNGLDSWCGTCIAMSDEDGDGVFTKTISLPSGAVEYKFLNGGWDGAESFDPAIHGACTLTTGEFTNRLVTVPEGVASLAVPVVCFNSCEPCSGQPCASDTNGNGICDEDDIAGCTYTWSANFDPLATMDDGSCEDPGGTNASCVADLTEDGVVTISDLLLVLAAFGEVCE